MRRVLITGGGGFVGGHVATRAAKTWEVFATYRTSSFSFPGVTPVRVDLEDGDGVRRCIREIRPAVILHCAAWTDLDVCEKDRARAFSINTEATTTLAELGSELGCRFVYTSTDMVFDGRKGDYSESDVACPINAYGESKLAGEERVKAICSDSVVARVALVYGPPLTGSNSFSERILERVSRGEAVSLFTDQYRTPVFVQDLAKVLVELARMRWTGTIHLGGAERVDRYTFGLRLAEIKGFSEELFKPISMADLPTVAPRPRDVSLNISEAKTLLTTELSGYREGLYRA